MVNLNIISLANMLTKRPVPVIKTYLGHVSYSPKLLHDEITEPHICQVELSEIIRRDFQELNLKDLYKAPENQFNLLSLRHIEYGLVSNISTATIMNAVV